MKVRIEFTLDIDAKEWAEEFAIDEKEVREDVKSYFSAYHIIPDHLTSFVLHV